MMATLTLRGLFLAAIGLHMVLMAHSNPQRKTWWAKWITDDLYIAGRLSTSEIKFAREAGFKALITVESFPTADDANMADPLPSTAQTAQLAMEIGLNFSYIQNHSNWATLEAVQTFSAIFDSFPKPAILNCKTAYSAVFIGLMHYFNRSKTDPTAIPRMNVTTFFQRGVTHGFNFADDMNNPLKTLVLTVDGSLNSTPKDEIPKAYIDIPSWKFWKAKPLAPAKNIYLVGQIGRHEVQILAELGYKALVNLRKGVTTAGKPSQEESILLNIKDRTGTYDKNDKPVRQTKEVLEANRLNPMYPNSYINATSQYNYQSSNPLQFGDDVGYNETIAREAVIKANLTYMHRPVGGVYKYGLPLWEAYRDSLLDLGRTTKGIILQCRTGYRSAVVGLLMHGCLNSVNSSEALQLANDLGYDFGTGTLVVNLFKTVLDNREQHCESPTTTTTTIPPALTTTAAATSTKTSVLTLILLMVVYGLCSLQFT